MASGDDSTVVATVDFVVVVAAAVAALPDNPLSSDRCCQFHNMLYILHNLLCHTDYTAMVEISAIVIVEELLFVVSSVLGVLPVVWNHSHHPTH